MKRDKVMKTAELKKQLVNLLIDAHVTFSTHEIAEYLIKHGVTIQPKAGWHKDAWKEIK